ncbi:hypothetical protein D9M71_800890 [compost metagenome]
MMPDDPAATATHHRQWQFQALGRCRAGVRYVAVNADFRRRIKAQAQTFFGRLQTVFQISVEALRIKMAEQ